MRLSLVLISRIVAVHAQSDAAQSQDAQAALESFMQNPTMSSLQSLMAAQTALSDQNSVSSIINSMLESFVMTYSGATAPANGASGPTPGPGSGPSPTIDAESSFQYSMPISSGLMTDPNSFSATTASSGDFSPALAVASDTAVTQANPYLLPTALSPSYASQTNAPSFMTVDTNLATNPASFSTAGNLPFGSSGSDENSGSLYGSLLTDTSSSIQQFVTGIPNTNQFNSAEYISTPTGTSDGATPGSVVGATSLLGNYDSNGLDSSNTASVAGSSDVFNDPSMVSLSQLFITATDPAVQQSALSAINGLYSTLNGQTLEAQATSANAGSTTSLLTDSGVATGAAFASAPSPSSTDSLLALLNASSTSTVSSVENSTQAATAPYVASFTNTSVLGGGSNSTQQPLVVPNHAHALNFSTVGLLLALAALSL